MTQQFSILKIQFSIKCLLIIGLLIVPANVHAQSALGLSAIPPRLEITAKPGTTITKEVKIRNESKIERLVNTSSKDFIVADDNGTPIQLEDLDESANRWAASSWVHISPSSFRLRPGETKALTVTVIVPQDALPGGHYAMVLHQANNQSVLSSSGAFIETNVGTLLYLTVPGDIQESAQIKQFSAPYFSEHGPINFTTVIFNSSDIHITPSGSIAIANWLGDKTTSLGLSTTNIFPNTSRRFENTLTKKWLFGRYSATINAGYGSTGQALVATIFFWVIPWRLMILILLAIVLTIFIYLLVKKNLPSPDDQVTEFEKELDSLKKKYQDRK